MRRERAKRGREGHPQLGEPPWGRLYALVLGTLALLVLAFYLFSRAFA